MRKVSYFCDYCGAQVEADDRRCPSCGKSFSAVRCPRCGRTGPARLFREGCPDCGYSSPSQESPGEAPAFAPVPRAADRPLGVPGWSLVIVIFVSAVAALVFSILR